MTRRLSSVPATGPVEDLDQCLLCGAEATTFSDLCDHCAGVVQAVADRVAARVVAELSVIPGQLELDDDQ